MGGPLGLISLCSAGGLDRRERNVSRRAVAAPKKDVDFLPQLWSIAKKRNQKYSGVFLHEIPLVIISSLRLVYLKMVLESINNQIAQFPQWLASKRYAFVHLHPKNYKNGILGQIQALAQMHGFSVHVFEGLDDPSATMSMNANHLWYPMTNFTFSKLGFQEA
jgi:hypothetical protein